MPRLQILVPHWQETPETMRPLLDSIALQQSVDMADIGVIIAFDGDEATPLPLDEWRSRYPFEITDIHPQHGGVSHARNAALDAATGEYVMLCDADDMLCDVCGLYIVFREMDNGGFDTMISSFREETRDADGNPVFIVRRNDATFVHGKVHRRQYLADNHIRFDERLFVHEDGYFNALCRECADPSRVRVCEDQWYMWKWRNDSTCRGDPKYILKTYGHMIDSNDALVDAFVVRGMFDKANAYAAMMFWNSYFTMNKGEWRDQENVAYRDATERRFAKYVRKHHAKWDAVPETDKLVMSQGIRQRSISEGMLLEALTIDQWLNRILEKYPE